MAGMVPVRGESTLDKEQGMIRLNSRSIHRLITLTAALGIGAVIVWQAASLGRANAVAGATMHGFQRLRLYSSTIANALDRYSYLPFMLAEDGKVQALMRNPADPMRLRAVNEWLETANAATGANALYIEDLTGTAIAANNWREPDTYVGHNYEFRPFFKDAVSGDVEAKLWLDVHGRLVHQTAVEQGHPTELRLVRLSGAD